MRMLLLLAFLFGSCGAVKIKSNCPELTCTQQFVMVQVQFNDASGKPVIVDDFEAVIERTGKVIIQEGTSAMGPGYYNVATDADRKSLLPSGDIIMVSASHPETGKKVSAEFRITGGECACHISKLSGPEIISF